ncbi:MAG: sulfite exporter TauE/SafE family protein [Gammaproteobacteria bacterium]|nr:sulfite exporter TauE/SafE family protein [Gammaproteobacteria bacterium]
MTSALITALILGLFSSIHCVGMCGGIMGALTFSLPVEVRSNWRRMLPYVLLYNLGRLFSYAAAGALFGVIGAILYKTVSPHFGYLFLQYLAALIMISLGLYIAGWFPKYAYIERAAAPIWRRLEPIGRRLLPVQSPLQAFAYGLIWGWLPCGLVYSALLLTITSSGPVEGALFMLAFGLGTLPAIMGIAILAEKVVRYVRKPAIRMLAGLFLIMLGLTGLLFAEQIHKLSPFMNESEMECTSEQL